jgi:hypothetical protein
MKSPTVRTVYLGFAMILASTLALAQASTHQNTLKCSAASADSTATNPGTTNAYRSVGPGNTTFVKYKTGLSPLCDLVDTTVVSAQVTNYYFTALIGGVESLPTNTVTLTTPTFSPGNATGTAQ